MFYNASTCLFLLELLQLTIHSFVCQAAQGGGKIILEGLYSGLAGNLAGVLP